jgi:hypothetical protein
VPSLEKSRLLLFPLLIGIMLMVYSWCVSYPLSIDSLDDFVFNHISLLYWYSLPVILTSMCAMAITSKNNSLKWIVTIGLVISIYSLSYFYYMLPGSDSHYFRGLTEYFIKTKDLDPLKPNHLYFQWPSFFLLSDMATSVSGMELAKFEFLLYTMIGFLMATAMYVYASKTFKKWGFLAVIAFFIAMFYFLNYQSVPFSLASGLLLILFMMETKQKSSSIILTTLVLYTGMSFVHAFVPLFFVLYLLMRRILNRNNQYGRLFVLTLIIYVVVQITQAPFSFIDNIRSVITLPSEYSNMVETTLAPVSVPFDSVAQMASRGVTITTVMVCLAGFTVLVIRRKIRDLDKAIFLTGTLYSFTGILLYALGSRAIPIVFIPISLGALYLFESRFRPYVTPFFLVLLMLFVFVPLHTSFDTSQIMYQTKEAYQTENFMIDHYNWTNPSLVLAHVRVITYLQTKQPSVAYFEDDAYSPLFPRIQEYDAIVYTVGLGINLLRYNYTTERILHEGKLNMVYNNGLSYVAMKSLNLTYARIR